MSFVDFRGGKSSLDTITNVRSLRGSQLRTDRGVSALLRNLRNDIPLVLIIGDQCRAAPVLLTSKRLILECHSPSILCDGLVSYYACLGFRLGDEVNSSASPIPIPLM